MISKPGLLVTGTDTDVGKTYVAAMLARQLRDSGRRVGVYKPVASGCRRVASQLVSDDAVALWEAAGQPLTLNDVCPQCFEAPLAPNIAARLEGRTVDESALLGGLNVWCEQSDVVIVEGAGGWFSPLGEQTLVADLARQLQLPVLIVARNVLGTINHTLLTLRAIEAAGLNVSCVVLNAAAHDDPSAATNAAELRRWTNTPIVELARHARSLDYDPFTGETSTEMRKVCMPPPSTTPLTGDTSL